jgi:hypothetical protein
VTRLAFVLVLLARLAHAHSFDPTLLDLREREPGVYDVVWKPPAVRADESRPIRVLSPVFSAACKRIGEITRPGAEGFVVFRMDCRPRGLRGETIAVAGLAGHPADVIVRIAWADGTTTASVLRSDATELLVPGVGAGAPLTTVLWRYGALGVEHILEGTDHLAFVFALLLLVHGWRRLVGTITAFTLAHTLTLGLAVMGVLYVPSAPVEAMIALSIVLVAVEALRPPDRAPTLAHRQPWLVAFLFGLMHGLGFAGALAGLGLPRDQVPAALLAFNVGVEVGQLAFVAVMMLPVLALRRLPGWAQAVPAYAIGAMAVAWTFERITAFWS